MDINKKLQALIDEAIEQADGEIVLLAIYPSKNGEYEAKSVVSEHTFEECVGYLQRAVRKDLAEGA